MKRFVRTIAGKTTLFIVFTLCLCIFIACVTSAVVIFNENMYETSEDTYLQNFQKDIVYNQAFNYAANQLIYNEEYYLDSNIGVIIYDEKGNAVASANNAELMQNDENYMEYKFSLGLIKKGDKITDMYWNKSTAADKNAIYYSMRVYADKNSPINESYAFVSTLVHLAFELKYAVYPIGFVALLACIIIFITLMYVAGRRSDTDELCPGTFFKVPYDLILVIFFILGIFSIESIFSLGNVRGIISLIIVLLVGANTALGLCMSFASRVKQKALIHNTIIYKCLRLFRNILRWVWKSTKGFFKWFWDIFHNIPMVWRTALIISGICFIEFVTILICQWNIGTLILFWFIEKLLLVPAVLFAAITMRKLQKAGNVISKGDLSYKLETKGLFWDFKRHAENLNNISDGMSQAVDQRLKSERMKTELITNVSHDIKTPLTSIINYATLIGDEKTDNQSITEYSEVLVRQSEKLKRLIEDLVEASKASSGSLEVTPVPCDAAVFISQASGEYEEKIKDAGLSLVTKLPEQELRIMADSRRMWRIFDNLMNNVCKYSQCGTRVYLSLDAASEQAVITFKNTSREPLNISADELMERFVRGDSSRNTEGNGLGLSIARSLTELQGGTFDIDVDGDLFKVTLRFPTI